MNNLSGIGLWPPGAFTQADRNDPAALRKAAQGVESLFLYELIKLMRESAGPSTPGSFGSSAYMSMFDLELSRVLADRGVGIADVLLRSLKRNQAAGAPPDSGTRPLPALPAAADDPARASVTGETSGMPHRKD